jgi:hypothetical protein
VRDFTCDRCGQAGETALCIGSFEYLCEEHWGTGRHMCQECETKLTCCGCEGAGCVTCALPSPPVEGEAA